MGVITIFYKIKCVVCGKLFKTADPDDFKCSKCAYSNI